MALTIAHTDGNCGNFTCGNTFDRFEVRNGAQVVATLTANYHEGKTAFECSEINHAIADGIHGDMHLIGCVSATIMRAFTEDHEFYCQPFTDENGDDLELELFDPLTA